MKRFLFSIVALALAAPLSAQNAQTAQQSQLRLIVVDQTGAGIPAATVTLTPSGGAPVTVESDERGVAALPNLPVGAAQLHVEFVGFEAFDQPVTLRRGANNQTVTLTIAGFQDEIVVEDTTALDDRRGNSMSTTLEQSEIDALPDDPEELADFLTQLAGGAGVTFQVNGFRGGRLPTKDEIQQIRFRTNSFAADNHDAGRTQVEIITRPNIRQWSGNANMNFRSDVMNARNAFAEEKTPEQIRGFNLGARGPLVAGRTSIRFQVEGRRDNQSDTIFAIDPISLDPNTKLRQSVRRPNDQTNFTTGFEHALTNTHTLRIEARRGESSSDNVGVGGFNLPERGYSRSSDNTQLRFQVQGVVGKASLNEFRVQFRDQNNTQRSLTDAPTLIVQDAFSLGGAGVNSESSSRTIEISDDFDFNVGRKQQMRVGILMEAGDYDYFDLRNSNGTFTYASLEDFKNQQPTTYTRRLGEVRTAFNQYQLGFYWQDDIRINAKLSVSVGVRNELQSHIDDKLNLMPRVGFTYTPRGNRTTIRGGYGLFHEWYESNLYDQTLRLNGNAQQEIIEQYVGTARQTSLPARLLAAEDLKMPKIHQASIGVERQLAQNLTVQATYQSLRGRDELRTIDINPGIGTNRPDPTRGPVREFSSTGRSNTDRLQFSANYRVPSIAMFLGGSYTLGRVRNFSDSSTALPANSLDPNAEWGPSSQDVRHRFQIMSNMPLLFGTRTQINLSGQSAAPYTITTGRDDNQDGYINDRPAGVGRNTERGAATWNMNMRLFKTFSLGAPRVAGIGGGQGGGGRRGGGAQGEPAAQRGQGGGGGNNRNFNNGGNGRYELEVFLNADNILNRVNYGGFSGNMLSSFFGQPTLAQNARRVQVGMGFRF